MIRATLAQLFHADSGGQFFFLRRRQRVLARGVPVLVNEVEAANAVYGRRDSIVVRRIAGEHLLVPIRRHVGQMRAIFAVTGAGASIFELLDGARSLGEVRDALLERFEVSGEQAWAELCSFVEELEEQGLVERRG